MADSYSLAQVIRRWHLPLDLSQERDAVELIAQEAQAADFRLDDLVLLLEEQTEVWETTGKVGPELEDTVELALRFTPSILASINAKSFFAMYKKLRRGTGDVARLSHTVASRLLSRAPLIGHLLEEERFSCSQIARLLAATDKSLNVSYGAVAVIARELGMLPRLDPDQSRRVLQEDDRDVSVALFPDSSRDESNEIAATELEFWLPEVDVKKLLAEVSRYSSKAIIEPFWPYIQILHWCLTSVEFYDHPVSYLYEFSPRGNVGLELFSMYPAVTGNPVLNNAKAVATLDNSWARNRGGGDAHALVELLRVIESLPFVPRREVSRILRAWILRIIELCKVEPVPVEVDTTLNIFDQFMEHVTMYETYTQGVLEQRAVDCLSVLTFGKPGWRPRGLGDGVNASNLSRRKLGDVEFANVDQRYAIALEAHGGFLSATYVADHARSLSRIVKKRLEESWADLDDAEAWTVHVLFVAHSKEEHLPTEDILHGVPVIYEYIDYAELLDRARSSSTPEQRIDTFEQHVVQKINEATVRESVRDSFRTIIGIA